MPITRSANQGNLQFDLEINRTLRRLRIDNQWNLTDNTPNLDILFASYSESEEEGIHG